MYLHVWDLDLVERNAHGHINRHIRYSVWKYGARYHCANLDQNRDRSEWTKSPFGVDGSLPSTPTVGTNGYIVGGSTHAAIRSWIIPIYS